MLLDSSVQFIVVKATRLKPKLAKESLIHNLLDYHQVVLG